jgi:parvulin-like peptidyl-prolyl isomerase
VESHLGRAAHTLIGALTAAACFGALPVRAERVLIDSVAAVVDRRVFTWGEIAAEGRILLVNKVGARAVQAGMDTAFLDSVLDFVIVQELLLGEARKGGFTAREQDVDKGVALFKLRFDNEESYRAFLAETGVDEETVRNVVRRDQAVELLLQAVVEEKGQPTPEMLDRFLSARRGFRPDLDDGARRAAADVEIRALERADRFALLVETLRARTDVRLVPRPQP